MKRLAALLLISVSAMCEAQYLDASNFEEAITMGAISIRSSADIRDQCTKLFPDKEFNIQTLSLKWLDRNSAEDEAVTMYMDTASARVKQIVDASVSAVRTLHLSLPDYAQKNYCFEYFSSIDSGSQDISKKTPNVSKFLAEYLADHKIEKTAHERYSFILGCVKGRANHAIKTKQRFVLDEAQSQCTCVWNVRQEHTTAEERSSEDPDDAHAVAMLPHTQRLIPLYSACMTKK